MNTKIVESELWELFCNFIPETHKERIKNKMHKILNKES